MTVPTNVLYCSRQTGHVGWTESDVDQRGSVVCKTDTQILEICPNILPLCTFTRFDANVRLEPTRKNGRSRGRTDILYMLCGACCRETAAGGVSGVSRDRILLSDPARVNQGGLEYSDLSPLANVECARWTFCTGRASRLWDCRGSCKKKK